MADRRLPRVLLGLVVVLWAGAFARDAGDRWVAATDLPVLVQAVSPEVRDRAGRLLRAYPVGEGTWRMAVSRDAVDPLFFDMLVAWEDGRFFDHHGVDTRAVARAAWQALRHGGVVSGASTLTMQVARLLEDSGTGSWSGKLRQVRVALALERRLSKDEILDLYLSLAPYGGNVEGVRAASLAWLGKEPTRLTAAEAALLVALPQSPEARRPDRHPEVAKAARDRVLARMGDLGVIAPEAARVLVGDPVPAARHEMPFLAPHMADRAVAAGPGVHRLTLDAGLQRAMEDLVRHHMAGRDPRLSMALVLADVESGEVLASVGAPDYTDAASRGFVDMTQAKRSPGSTLKPLVYGLAFDRGLAHPETLILDAPVRFGRYAPQNFDGMFRGEVSAARALQLSLNIPAVRLTEALGPAQLMAALERTGLAPELAGGRPGLALALGGVGLTLEEMVQLYAAQARGGVALPLRWRADAPGGQPVRMLSRASAWQVGHVLAQIPPPPSAGAPGRVAWKTGTSYGHRDAWALGWDGRHVAGVWIGRADGTPVPGAFGGDLAAPALFRALERARSGPAPLPAPPPETLMVDNAHLPRALQRFGPQADDPGLDLTFPPEGARLEASGAVPVKLRGGTPPYTLLVDGAVAETGRHVPEFLAPVAGPGFTTLSVIDAAGRSGRVRIELR